MLVVSDSLAFHGPSHAELLTHPHLYPNVLSRLVGRPVDCVARLGWTSRDAWWTLTKDPYVYSVLLPRADAVVLAVGGGDHLPASLPPYLRDGIAYVRPGSLRRGLRAAYHRAHPYIVRAHGGRIRVLPQRVTDAYLSRCVEALRVVRPGLLVVGVVPPPYDAPYHGHVSRPHEAAVVAARRWGERLGVPMVDEDAVIEPYLRRGELNPDGMHWSWAAHEAVAREMAATLWRSGLPRPA